MAKLCTAVVTHSYVKVQENKSAATFSNKKNLKYHVTEVDGCLIDDGIKCDYLVSEETDVSVLVELKGTGVDHACNQLFATAENPKVKKILADKLGFLIVCTRYPKFDSFVVKAKSVAQKKYGCGLHVVTGKVTVDIHEVSKINGRP